MSKYLMKCGHANNAWTSPGHEPACAICGCTEVEKEIQDPHEGLEGRIARCSYGPHRDVPSAWNLAFFEYRPDKEYDLYYCGCYGWD